MGVAELLPRIVREKGSIFWGLGFGDWGLEIFSLYDWRYSGVIPALLALFRRYWVISKSKKIPLLLFPNFLIYCFQLIHSSLSMQFFHSYCLIPGILYL